MDCCFSWGYLNLTTGFPDVIRLFRFWERISPSLFLSLKERGLRRWMRSLQNVLMSDGMYPGSIELLFVDRFELCLVSPMYGGTCDGGSVYGDGCLSCRRGFLLSSRVIILKTRIGTFSLTRLEGKLMSTSLLCR